MRQLNHVNINPDGRTVTIGGGAESKEVISTLWAAGKQTGESLNIGKNI